MMGEQRDNQQRLFYSFNLDEHVPADHLLRGINQFLDLYELRPYLAPFYSHAGRELAALEVLASGEDVGPGDQAELVGG